MEKNTLPSYLPENFYEQLEEAMDEAVRDYYKLNPKKILSDNVIPKRTLTKKLLCVLGAVSVYAGITTAGNLYQDYIHNPVVSMKPSYDDSDYDDLFLGAEIYQDNSSNLKKELEAVVKKYDTPENTAKSQALGLYFDSKK